VAIPAPNKGFTNRSVFWFSTKPFQFGRSGRPVFLKTELDTVAKTIFDLFFCFNLFGGQGKKQNSGVKTSGVKNQE
jgi:hypothetical protein